MASRPAHSSGQKGNGPGPTPGLGSDTVWAAPKGRCGPSTSCVQGALNRFNQPALRTTRGSPILQSPGTRHKGSGGRPEVEPSTRAREVLGHTYTHTRAQTHTRRRVACTRKRTHVHTHKHKRACMHTRTRPGNAHPHTHTCTPARERGRSDGVPAMRPSRSLFSEAMCCLQLLQVPGHTACSILLDFVREEGDTLSLKL